MYLEIGLFVFNLIITIGNWYVGNRKLAYLVGILNIFILVKIIKTLIPRSW